MLPGSTTPSEDDITYALSNILKANKAISGDVRSASSFRCSASAGKAGTGWTTT